MIPEGHLLLVRAPHPFDLSLLRETKAFGRASAVHFRDGRWGVLLPVPDYGGTGLHADRLKLTTTVYTPQGIQRNTTSILILPPAGRARVVSSMTGRQVRETPGVYAVLSNGAGAMAQVRAEWGEIRSQYDCLLAVNPHPHVPVDKMIFWTRCRAWVNDRGYSQAINASCLSSFETDPAGRFAEWQFRVPCGMGHCVSLQFRLEMVRDLNQVHLMIRRIPQASGKEPKEAIQVILRPDIEWRSFHHTTKAFMGPEQAWAHAVRPWDSGFEFRPDGHETLTLVTDHGTYHPEPSWTYMVPHPEEAERGLDAGGDVYSPGWFGVPLAAGQQMTLTAQRVDGWKAASSRSGEVPESAQGGSGRRASLPFDLPTLLPRALSLYVVKRDALRTVIAGYPWFLDWGRDTLIVLRGLIAAGMTEEALASLIEFGRFEKNGTIPNMIRGEDDGNRETSDAPLWFCVAAGDLMDAVGDDVVLHARCGDRTLKEVMRSIVEHYAVGTPNGIHMDPASGLIYSPAHYTWMDTNYPAATPRQGYPVEIQALWIAALRRVARKIDASWNAKAEQATDSLERYFSTPEGWFADCLRASPGVPAERAVPEDAVRSNQLLAVTLDVLRHREIEQAILHSCEGLLVPGAIRSLADREVKADMGVFRDGVLLNKPHHPYQGQYRGDEDTRRKPAYHNGTAWTWTFPHYVEALVKVYGVEARKTGLSLLGSLIELFNQGCLCHLPEICDGDAPHLLRGCGAQAWGISELLRVWKRVEALD